MITLLYLFLDIVIKVSWTSIVARKLEVKILTHASIINVYTHLFVLMHGLISGIPKLQKTDSLAIFNQFNLKVNVKQNKEIITSVFCKCITKIYYKISYL